MRFLTAVFFVFVLLSGVFPQEEDDEILDLFQFPDKKALEESKAISQITVVNCYQRLILNRDGRVQLIGSTRKLKEGNYVGNMVEEEEMDLQGNPYFDSIAYLIHKLGIMELPDVIEGAADHFCRDSFEIVSGGVTKSVKTLPEAFVPELEAISALISRVPEFVELSPFLDASELKNIRLETIVRITPKGRVQDVEYNQIKTIEYLVAVGKPSIPWLIEQLDDDTKIDHHVMDYWHQVHVGDIALVVLSSFFKNRDYSSTLPGFNWDNFLERQSPVPTSESVLRTYIEKHGRKKIKQRWTELWNKHKEDIEWERACHCFEIRRKK